MKVVNWIRQNKILLLVVFVGSILRFYKLDFQSPWIDEIFTLHNTGSEKSFKEIYIFLKENDPHPPLYYFTIHFFNLFLDNSSFITRFISAVFGIAGIFSVYYLAKELLNKQVALISVALLVVNYFHIYYSQEARMYTMLFFTTTMSFLYLIKFIKSPSIKSALLHSLFASLMINTHFFALFALFSQYLILLFFVIKPYKETQKRFLLFCLLSGITTLIVFIPSLFVFLKTSEMKSIWIPIPERDVYTVMFKEFFGYTETAIFVAMIGILLFFVKLSQRKQIQKTNINPEIEKQTFSFFILFTWILISLLVPLLISFINLPMIVSRYFINIVPAIIIMVAAGLYYFKNTLISGFLIILFMVFSVSDIIWIKKYYQTPAKSQFREVTSQILNENTNKDKVVTYWSWLLPYFFKDTGIAIRPNSLEEYVLALKNGSVSDEESFWYLDGQFRPFNLSQEDQNYLSENFILKQKIEKLDSWAYFYQSKNRKVAVSNSELSLKSFKTTDLDGQGNVMLFENTILKSDAIILEKGNYEFILEANSLPNIPINGENAHVRIKINGLEIGQLFLNEKLANKKNVLKFNQAETHKIRAMIIFDNDLKINEKDRNVVIYSIKLQKIK
jgi:4-amino-4-deoxy-L-arabinose transferase-like glycosyltransferase